MSGQSADRIVICVTVFIPPLAAGFYPPDNEMGVRLLCRVMTLAGGTYGLKPLRSKGDLNDSQMWFEAHSLAALEMVRHELEKTGILEYCSIVWKDEGDEDGESQLYYPLRGSWDEVSQSHFRKWFEPTHSVKPERSFFLEWIESSARIALKHLKGTSLTAKLLQKCLRVFGKRNKP